MCGGCHCLLLCRSLAVCFLPLSSGVLLASMAIGSMLKLVVCCNHIAGVVVRWVSPYMSLDSSLHMVLIRHICNFGLVDDG